MRFSLLVSAAGVGAAALNGFNSTGSQNSSFVNELLKANSTAALNTSNSFPEELTLGVSQLPNVLNESAVDANAEAKGYRLVNVSRNACGVSGFLRLEGN